MNAVARLIVQGALIGGLYALFATGLSLIFGVMRLVNLAHGDLIVLAAFVALVCVQYLGFSPLATLIIVVPVMAGFGYVLQRLLLNRTLGGDILPPLLVTFGLSIMIQNALLEGFSADSRKLALGSLGTASVQVLPGLTIGWYPLIVLIASGVVIGGLQLFLYRTKPGAALRATSVSGGPASADLPGRHVDPTVRASRAVLAGQPPTPALVPVRVAALTKGVLREMLLTIRCAPTSTPVPAVTISLSKRMRLARCHGVCASARMRLLPDP